MMVCSGASNRSGVCHDVAAANSGAICEGCSVGHSSLANRILRQSTCALTSPSIRWPFVSGSKQVSVLSDAFSYAWKSMLAIAARSESLARSTSALASLIAAPVWARFPGSGWAVCMWYLCTRTVHRYSYDNPHQALRRCSTPSLAFDL